VTIKRGATGTMGPGPWWVLDVERRDPSPGSYNGMRDRQKAFRMPSSTPGSQAVVMSKAKTVQAYLEELPPQRRGEIATVRALVAKHLPKGYEEAMDYGMITWSVPLATYSDPYNKRPLCYLALAAQKGYNALYLMGCHAGPPLETLKEAYRKAGRKLDMGKSCLRFQEAAELPAEVIGGLIAELDPARFIAMRRRALAMA
jgi:hypothetical protein